MMTSNAASADRAAIKNEVRAILAASGIAGKKDVTSAQRQEVNTALEQLLEWCSETKTSASDSKSTAAGSEFGDVNKKSTVTDSNNPNSNPTSTPDEIFLVDDVQLTRIPEPSTNGNDSISRISQAVAAKVSESPEDYYTFLRLSGDKIAISKSAVQEETRALGEKLRVEKEAKGKVEAEAEEEGKAKSDVETKAEVREGGENLGDSGDDSDDVQVKKRKLQQTTSDSTLVPDEVTIHADILRKCALRVLNSSLKFEKKKIPFEYSKSGKNKIISY
jgi:hypothetical protein